MGSSRLLQTFCVLASFTSLSAQIITECNRAIDVVFVVDGSNVSQATATSQMTSLNDVVQRLNVQPAVVNVGGVYVGNFLDWFGLKSSASEFVQETRDWVHPGPTNSIHVGLNYVGSVLQDRTRTNVSTVVILISNGLFSTLLATTEATALRSNGINVFAVGVGNSVSTQELAELTNNINYVVTEPNSSNTIDDALFQILRIACNSVGGTTTETTATTATPTTPMATSTTIPPRVCNYGNVELTLLVDVSRRTAILSTLTDPNDFGHLENSLSAFTDLVVNERQASDNIGIGLISYSDANNLVVNASSSNSLTTIRDAVKSLPNGVPVSGSNLQLALQRITRPVQQSDYRHYIMIITSDIFLNDTIRDQVVNETDRVKALGYTVVTMPITILRSAPEELFQILASDPRYIFPATSYTTLETSLRNFESEILCAGPDAYKIPGLCANSGRERNGNAYARHPYQCEFYLQCYYNAEGEFDMTITRRCPTGLHWNDDIKRCDLPRNARCPQDNCRETCGPSRMETSCRGYFECENGYSVPKCCKEHFMFVEGKGCVKDNEKSCKDDCYANYTKCREPACKKSPNWSHAGSYHLDRRSGSFQTTRSCFGKDFHAVTCDCSAPRGHVCDPDFTVSFTDAATVRRLESGTMRGISVRRGVFQSTGLILGEGSNIHLNATSKRGNEPLMLKFRYRESPRTLPTNSSIVLLTSSSNCPGCNGKLTFEIGQRFLSAIFEAPDGTYGRVGVSTIGMFSTEFKDVSLIYVNQGRVGLSIKGVYQQYIQTARVPEGLVFPCGFDFGSTIDYDGFRGSFESISLFSCIPAKFE